MTRMRNIISAFSLLCIVLTCEGQLNLTPSQARARRIAVAKYDPLRIIDGKLYDLTEVIYGYKLHGFTIHSEDHWVSGRVISVTKQGVLIDNNQVGELETVFLKNAAAAHNSVDGDRIHCAAMKAGRYEYTAASGAKKTVVMFDYGEPLAQSKKTFDQVIKISANGKQAFLVKFEP